MSWKEITVTQDDTSLGTVLEFLGQAHLNSRDYNMFTMFFPQGSRSITSFFHFSCKIGLGAWQLRSTSHQGHLSNESYSLHSDLRKRCKIIWVLSTAGCNSAGRTACRGVMFFILPLSRQHGKRGFKAVTPVRGCGSTGRLMWRKLIPLSDTAVAD